MIPVLTGIDHVHVYVSDRVAAEEWYDRVLGLKRMQDLAFWAADGGPLTVANASNTIHLALFEQARQQCRSTVALGAGAEDFLAWRKHLQSVLEREVEAVDHQVAWSLYFQDPDGNPFEITSYEHAIISTRLLGAGA
jgi:catechol-2,3-dioxygenase